VYSDAELEQASLPIAAMRDAYQVVADRIGISGGAGDDAWPYLCGDLLRTQPPTALDPTAAFVAARYRRQRDRLRARGYHLGRPALALLTQPKDDRGATQLLDMDFYVNPNDAAWRPALALDELRRHPNFAYAGDVLITRFDERDEGVDVAVLDLQDRTHKSFRGRRLALACGVLGTARIVLRSFPGSNARLPLLCNDYTYVPCVVPSRLGRAMPEHNNSLTQLAIVHDPDFRRRDVAVGTIFSYRSLLLFRLLREVPLGVRDARALLQYLLSGFLIAGFDHPQAYSDGKRLWLESDATSPTSDRLAIDYTLTGDELLGHDARERAFLGVLRSLGAWPIKRVHPPLGSSIHYAGTLPETERDAPFTLSASGRLHGTRNVYVADGSGFTFLPAKGVTLSLMANAHRVAAGLAGAVAG
jgi:hypothetical protein